MRYTYFMRTTLEIDDDLVQTARQLSTQRHMTIGQVVSELMRKGIESKTPSRLRNGVLLFAPKAGAKRPDLALVNRLRDGE